MIVLDNLGDLRRGRIWINEKPKIKSVSKEIIELKIGNAIKCACDIQSICIELFLGPRDISNYGLLGVELLDNNSNQLNLIMNVSDVDESIYYENLAMQTDEVHIGIPRIYAKSILNVSEKIFKESDRIPAVDLTFGIGAHGYVGSSQLIFTILTKIIISLLKRELNCIPQEELKRIVKFEIEKNL